jgi:nucleotide-binding universal stress UspA family protein
MMAIERILVPIDFSQPSLRALDDAVEFSRPYEARLTILYVVERGFYGSQLLSVTDPRDCFVQRDLCERGFAGDQKLLFVATHDVWGKEP